MIFLLIKLLSIIIVSVLYSKKLILPTIADKLYSPNSQRKALIQRSIKRFCEIGAESAMIENGIKNPILKRSGVSQSRWICARTNW
jgi:hypothetical protein